MTGEKILVVDDSDSGRYLKSHILRRSGFEIRETGTGKQALDTVEAWRPQLVLLDVKLPDGSGIDVCRKIKATHPSTVVLQTSAAFVSAEDRASGLEGGADSYLIEPIESEELIASVESLLRLRRAEQELRAVNDSLELKVAERTAELNDSNQRLEEEIRQRSAAEEELRHALKLDALGQLTGGIAHDFNNLLTVVLGSLTMIDKGLRHTPAISAEEILRLVDGGKKAAVDCEYLTQRLLSFARKGTLSFEILDINDRIAKFKDLLQHAAGAYSDLSFELAGDLWPGRVDASQFESAVLNLVVNARDAMPRGGKLSVRTSNLKLAPNSKPAALVLPDTLEPGDYLCLTVSDTGTGMDAEVLAHVFEPFFTTKDVGQGTGLGLSQVYGFAAQSGGAVAIDLELGTGTRVSILLPRAVGTTQKKAIVEQKDVMPGGHETILVVEDNELVLDFTVTTLQELGYRVLHALDGESALNVLRHEDDIKVLFTDMVMPNNMSGIELALAARRHQPDLKVLLTSGYLPETMRQNAAQVDFAYIAKPYDFDELAERLRTVLVS